jgi:hypothetical protein
MVFGSALEVQYSDKYPSLEFAIDGKDPLGLLPLVVKSDVWRYENEYRVVAQENFQLPREDILRTRRNFLKYPPGALRAVIMGCMVCQSDVAELRKIIDQQFRPYVALKRAVRNRDDYGLSIVVCP